MRRLLDLLKLDSAIPEPTIPLIEPAQEISDRELVTQPVVSVCIVTYNHQQWIRQAIESVVEQKTSFPFEIIIGEDCSTDQTRAIVLEYQKKYPSLIRVLISEKNVGATRNFWRILQSARGQYLAFLEGDDYWVSPSRLALQVQRLEESPASMLCAANTRIVVSQLGSPDKEVGFFVRASKPLASLSDVLVQQYHVSSCLMRATLLEEIKPWYQRYGNVLDIQMLCLAAKNRMIVYLDQVVSVRRSTGEGYYSILNGMQQHLFDVKWIYHIARFLAPAGDLVFLRRMFARGFEYGVLAKQQDRGSFSWLAYFKCIFQVSPKVALSFVWQSRRRVISGLLLCV